MPRPLCFYAAYDTQGVKDYVLDAVRRYSAFSDVYVHYANELSAKDKARLENYALGVFAYRHDEYDFGSWKRLLLLNRKKLSSYEQLILTNDSNYGPLFDMGDILHAMRKKPFWGITLNLNVFPHVQSYFLSVSKSVFSTSVFMRFFESVTHEKSKHDICEKYEIGLSRLIFNLGYPLSSYIKRDCLAIAQLDDPTSYPLKLLKNGSPFIKKKFFPMQDFVEKIFLKLAGL